MVQRLKPRRPLLRLAVLASASGLAFSAAAAPVPSASIPTVSPTSTTQPIVPLYGNLKPFYGNLSPFYGNLRPFYGNLKPFYGNLKPFWGDVGPLYGNLKPFWGASNPFIANTTAAAIATYGAGYDPFWGGGAANPYLHNPSAFVNYGQIAGFWSTEGASWAKVQTAWSAATTSADYTQLAAQIQATVINPAAAFWGAAIEHAKPDQKAASATLMSAFQAAGVAFNADGTINSLSLAGVSATDQALLFLTAYDNLMAYAGTGHVDWWMGATHWSPALAAIAGNLAQKDSPVTIGMLDFTVSNSQKNAKGSLLQYGSTVFSNGHGAAVGSLINGALDGSGVMGVLPAGAANVIVYDPYDASGTTNWTDVGTGIQVLANSTFKKDGPPTGVLNASLGVPGWTLHPGWNDALSSGAARGHNLVIAAGNDGVSQTANVPWNFALNPNIIVVGSVGVEGEISNFSNRPGEACLIDTTAASTQCVEANKLKYRFIVAPGELVLVSDGSGGVTRQSGTSLAAPQVAAAIGLLQARWPWLANYAEESAQIILKSATPLGTSPGADPFYGVGELNIQASQSPLSWNSLRYFPVQNGKAATTPISAAGVVSLVAGGSPTTWNASKLSITALEYIGGTYRDFQIPLAASLVGQDAPRASGAGVYQSYLATDLKAWVAGGAKFAATDPAAAGLQSFTQTSASLGRIGGMELRARVAPHAATYGFTTGKVESNADLALVGQTSVLRFGVGEGAAAMAGLDEFASSGPDLRRGGANPLLGLATGGAYVDLRTRLADRVALSFGATQRREARDTALFGLSEQATGARVYAASAERAGVEVLAAPQLRLQVSVTRLRENNALLGVQSLDASQLTGGSTTSGASIGVDWTLSHGLTLSARSTLAKTQTDRAQALRTDAGGLRTSATEVAVSKANLFAAGDRVRLSIAQTMHVTDGRLRLSSFGVTDRETGALGLIDQTADLAGSATPWAAEVLYGRLLKSGAEVSGFARAETQDTAGATLSAYFVGGRYRIAF